MTPADADAVAALHVASWRGAYRGVFTDDYLDHQAEAERREAWHARLNAPTGADWGVVAQDDTGRVLGFAWVMPDHDPTWGDYIDNLHVALDDIHLRYEGNARHPYALGVTLASAKPLHLVVIMLGTNDLKARIFGPSFSLSS